jgi:predicted NAD/FAD-dependent oxidoreductase
MTPQHIAIIGAGIAGLSCATTLQEAGHTVSVYDKGRGIGGRLSTRRSDLWQCDHGAQYFTAKNPEFVGQVAQWEAAGVAAPWDPVIHVYREGLWSTPNGTMKRYVGIPGMSAPARALAQPLNVQTSTTIERLLPVADGWQLSSTEYGLLTPHFSQVVIAVPPVQAAAILGNASEMLTGVAQSIVMQPCWTVLMQFDAQLTLPFEAAFINSGPLSWIARNSSKPGRSGQESWVMHATPAWTQAHLEETPAAVGPALIEAFVALGGQVPAVWSAHRWRYASSDPAIATTSVWDQNHGLGLCGDWLNGGRVEGAWLSGRSLATKML